MSGKTGGSIAPFTHQFEARLGSNLQQDETSIPTNYITIKCVFRCHGKCAALFIGLSKSRTAGAALFAGLRWTGMDSVQQRSKDKVCFKLLTSKSSPAEQEIARAPQKCSQIMSNCSVDPML